MLTSEERTLICQAVCDLASGNHLLRPRTAEQLSTISELCSIRKMKTTELTGHDVEVLQYAEACEEPNAAKAYLQKHPEYKEDFPKDCWPSTT